MPAPVLTLLVLLAVIMGVLAFDPVSADVVGLGGMPVVILAGLLPARVAWMEPACLMVYGPGRYRFTDVVRVGAPPTAVIDGLALLLVPGLRPL